MFWIITHISYEPWFVLFGSSASPQAEDSKAEIFLTGRNQWLVKCVIALKQKNLLFKKSKKVGIF